MDFNPSQSRMHWGSKVKEVQLAALRRAGIYSCSYRSPNLELTTRLVELDATNFYKTLSDNDLRIVCTNFALDSNEMVLQNGHSASSLDKDTIIGKIARYHASSDILSCLPSRVQDLEDEARQLGLRVWRGLKKWDLINMLIETHTRRQPGFSRPLLGTSSDPKPEPSRITVGTVSLSPEAGCNLNKVLATGSRTSDSEGPKVYRIQSESTFVDAQNTAQDSSPGTRCQGITANTCSPPVRDEGRTIKQTLYHLEDLKMLIRLYVMLVYRTTCFMNESETTTAHLFLNLFDHIAGKLHVKIPYLTLPKLDKTSFSTEFSPSRSRIQTYMSQYRSESGLGLLLYHYVECIHSAIHSKNEMDRKEDQQTIRTFHQELYSQGILRHLKLEEDFKIQHLDKPTYYYYLEIFDETKPRPFKQVCNDREFVLERGASYLAREDNQLDGKSFSPTTVTNPTPGTHESDYPRSQPHLQSKPSKPSNNVRSDLQTHDPSAQLGLGIPGAADRPSGNSSINSALKVDNHPLPSKSPHRAIQEEKAPPVADCKIPAQLSRHSTSLQQIPASVNSIKKAETPDTFTNVLPVHPSRSLSSPDGCHGLMSPVSRYTESPMSTSIAELHLPATSEMERLPSPVLDFTRSSALSTETISKGGDCDATSTEVSNYLAATDYRHLLSSSAMPIPAEWHDDDVEIIMNVPQESSTSSDEEE